MTSFKNSTCLRLVSFLEAVLVIGQFTIWMLKQQLIIFMQRHFELVFRDEFLPKTLGNSRWHLLTGHLLSSSEFTTFFADVEWIKICMNRHFSCSDYHLAALHNSHLCLNREALKYRFCVWNGLLIFLAGHCFD